MGFQTTTKPGARESLMMAVINLYSSAYTERLSYDPGEIVLLFTKPVASLPHAHPGQLA